MKAMNPAGKAFFTTLAVVLLPLFLFKNSRTESDATGRAFTDPFPGLQLLERGVDLPESMAVWDAFYQPGIFFFRSSNMGYNWSPYAAVPRIVQPVEVPGGLPVAGAQAVWPSQLEQQPLAYLPRDLKYAKVDSAAHFTNERAPSKPLQSPILVTDQLGRLVPLFTKLSRSQQTLIKEQLPLVILPTQIEVTKQTAVRLVLRQSSGSAKLDQLALQLLRKFYNRPGVIGPDLISVEWRLWESSSND